MADVLQMRRITGLFTARLPDGSDADEYPDTVRLSGRVTFHPEYKKPLVFPGEHIVLEPIPALLVDGQLMVEVLQGDDVVLQDLWLPVTVDERANQSWSWRMVFDHVTLGQHGDEVSLPDRRFPVEEGEGPLDLSDVAGTWSGGTLITRGAPGPGLQEIVAENGEITFLWDNSRTTTIEVPDAVEGPEGPRGERGPQGPAGTVELIGGNATITIDDSVGRRVFVGDEMVSGRTGLRDITSLVDAPHRPESQTGRLLVSRFGSIVTLSFQDLILGGTGTWVSLMTLPYGFRPATDMPDVVFTGNSDLSTKVPASLIVRNFGGVSIEKSSGNRHRRTIAYATTNPWPSSLPGIPA